MSEYILKLLDWPFLLFIGVAILLAKFRSEIGKVISRGGITLTWGDKSFEISELPEQLNENFAPISDDLEDIKARLTKLEDSTNVDSGESDKVEEVELTDEQVGAARERMLKALETGKYTWRSIERLAVIGAVTTAQASNILRPMQEVIFSRGKSGRTIVKLSSR